MSSSKRLINNVGSMVPLKNTCPPDQIAVDSLSKTGRGGFSSDHLFLEGDPYPLKCMRVCLERIKFWSGAVSAVVVVAVWSLKSFEVLEQTGAVLWEQKTLNPP
ncbi:hypothetical protein Tco_0044709 [Tanacetum coccineum]